VSRFLTVTGLALRELWISFRLLVAVGALILAALPAALLPQGPELLVGAGWTPLEWFGIGLGLALALVAALAAAAIAGERRRGTAGWLVSRAVPRPLVLLAWFSCFALVLVIGLLPAATLAWLTTGEASLGPGGGASFVAPILAVWTAGLAVVALGLLLGSLLPGVPAAVLALLLASGLLLPAASGLLPALAAPPSPGAGLAMLGDLQEAARPIADSLRSGGVSLVAAAAALVLGSAVLGRADL
jgi:hypothetical protein